MTLGVLLVRWLIHAVVVMGSVALVSPGNIASMRLLEKLGFSPAGRTRMTPGSADEVEVFALTF